MLNKTYEKVIEDKVILVLTEKERSPFFNETSSKLNFNPACSTKASPKYLIRFLFLENF